MAVSAATLPARSTPSRLWLYTRPFDLRFISLSVILVAAPYTVYLLLLNLGGLLGPVAASLNTTVDDLSRNFVNATVALLVGGPHMYATWTRTGLDHDFAKKHRKFLLSALIIPVVVTVAGALQSDAAAHDLLLLGVDPRLAPDHLHHVDVQREAEDQPGALLAPLGLRRHSDGPIPAGSLEDRHQQVRHRPEQPQYTGRPDPGLGWTEHRRMDVDPGRRARLRSPWWSGSPSRSWSTARARCTSRRPCSSA